MCVTALLMCRRQLALTSKDGDRKQARIQGLEEDAESLRREMKDHEGELHNSISEVLMYYERKLLREKTFKIGRRYNFG